MPAPARTGRRDAIREGVRLLSGWLVALLAVAAAWFALARAPAGSRLRWAWYALVAVALVRAAHRTWQALRRRGVAGDPQSTEASRKPPAHGAEP